MGMDEAALEELEELDFTEDQASFIFVLLENRPPRRRKSWKENKTFKAEARKAERLPVPQVAAAETRAGPTRR